MGKPPSPETQLRAARSDLRRLKKELAEARKQCSDYRARATKAEQEVSEWKHRFDALIRRDDGKARSAA